MKLILSLLLGIPSITYGQTLVTSQEVSTDTVMTLSSTQTVTASKTFSNTANVYYGDGSHLSGLTAIGDNLGNHIATTTLQMGDFQITSSSSISTNDLTTRLVKYTILSSTTGTTVTPDSGYTVFIATATGGGLTINNPTGSVTDGQRLIIRITDDGTARELTFGTIYRAGTVALPTTTVVGKTIYAGFMYNSYATKWDLLALSQGF